MSQLNNYPWNQWDESIPMGGNTVRYSDNTANGDLFHPGDILSYDEVNFIKWLYKHTEDIKILAEVFHELPEDHEVKAMFNTKKAFKRMEGKNEN